MNEKYQDFKSIFNVTSKSYLQILKLPMEFLISFIQLERKEIAFNVNKSNSEK